MNITNFLSFDLGFFKTPLGLLLIVLMILLVVGIIVLLITGGVKEADEIEEIAPIKNDKEISLPTASEQMQKEADAIKTTISEVQKETRQEIFVKEDKPLMEPVMVENKETSSLGNNNLNSVVTEDVKLNEVPVIEEVMAEKHDLESPVLSNENMKVDLPIEMTEIAPLGLDNEFLQVEKTNMDNNHQHQTVGAYGGINPSAGINAEITEKKVPYGGVNPLEDTQKLNPNFINKKLSEENIVLPEINDNVNLNPVSENYNSLNSFPMNKEEKKEESNNYEKANDYHDDPLNRFYGNISSGSDIANFNNYQDNNVNNSNIYNAKIETL